MCETQLSQNGSAILDDMAPWGSFKNYVDKMREVGGQKMPIIVHVQGKKNPSGGSWN